jgi:hypothetical protein
MIPYEEFNETNFKLVIFSGDLKVLLNTLLYQYNYEPQIFMTRSETIESITIKIGKLFLCIKSPVFDSQIIEIGDDSYFQLTNQQYDEYNRLSFELYGKLTNKTNMSNYSYNFVNVMRSYVRSAPRFAFKELKDVFLPRIGIDTIKAYTSYLLNLKQFPVFNCFDEFVLYNNEPIEDYNFYFIERLYIKDDASLILWDSTFNLTRGFHFKKIQWR